MQLLRLAKVRTVAPKCKFDASKVKVDLDTVKAVVRNRVDVMALYGRKVIRPVIQQERQNASDYLNNVYKKARRFMIREDIKLDVSAKAVLQEALSESNTLETVYQYKQKLKEIWARSTENQTKRVAKLQEWCAQAEQTGIKVLEDFAHSLRGYSLQPG